MFQRDGKGVKMTEREEIELELEELTKRSKWDRILFAVLLISLFAIGWFSNDIYRNIVQHRTINGLWINGVLNESGAVELAKSQDFYGDWICINTFGMSIDEVIRTCEHEAGHEIFAEYCEDNFDKCKELTK